jgi:phosphoribosylformylglycinamidine synthase
VRKPEQKFKENPPKEIDDYSDTLLKLLADPNLCSRDWVIRQYDHEVRGSTILRPLQGVLGHASHGDASVLKPVEESWKGLAIATAANPWTNPIDPYRGGKGVLDEMCRNIVAVGARPHSFSNCLNYGNPEIPERLGEFHETVKGLGEVAEALNLPTPSGNVSFYNETDFETVLPTATLLGVGMIQDVRQSITSDLKGSGNILYLIGRTGPEMGGSAYYRMMGASSPRVPDVDIQALKDSMDALLSAMAEGLVRSCHDISDGGLAAAVSEMCIGGQIGAAIDLDGTGELRTDKKLFSESNTRWLVEIEPANAPVFESIFGELPAFRIGEIGGDN